MISDAILDQLSLELDENQNSVLERLDRDRAWTDDRENVENAGAVEDFEGM